MHKSSYIHEPCNSNAIFLHLPFATWNYLVHQFQLPQESPELVFPTKTTCVEPILVFPWMMHSCNIVTNENSDVNNSNSLCIYVTSSSVNTRIYLHRQKERDLLTSAMSFCRNGTMPAT